LVAELGSGDDLSRRIYASHVQFGSVIRAWSYVAEGHHLSRPDLR
jgi:hypothetical protein